jgi:hypothetical protein
VISRPRVPGVPGALLVTAILLAPSASAQDARAAARFRIDTQNHLPFPSTSLSPLSALLLSQPGRSQTPAPVLPVAIERPSRRKYVWWGAAIGGALGLGVGYALIPRPCPDCWVPDAAYLLQGFVAGAAAGMLVGLLVHSWATESSGATR